MDLLFSQEMRGFAADLDFIKNGKWLKDSEVRYRLSLEKGRWHLTMLYVWVENPLQLICRFIDHYESENKALIYAELFKRGMQKDARGTQKTNENAFSIHLN
jgi:hypothetical protein